MAEAGDCLQDVIRDCPQEERLRLLEFMKLSALPDRPVAERAAEISDSIRMRAMMSGETKN